MALELQYDDYLRWVYCQRARLLLTEHPFYKGDNGVVVCQVCISREAQARHCQLEFMVREASESEDSGMSLFSPSWNQ